MSTDVAQKVAQVNHLLQAGEPGNITTDEHAGYTGYKPQSIVDAMNEGFNIGGWGFSEISSEIIPGDKGGLAIAQVQVWLAGIDFKPTSWGQNRVTRGDVGDAKKAAQTDAIKKALSYFSIGNRAYHGLLKENSNGHAQSGQTRRPAPTVASNGHQEPEVPSVKELQKRCNTLCGIGFWQAMILKALKVENMDIVLKDSDLTPDDRLKIAAYLDFVEKQKASATTGKEAV